MPLASGDISCNYLLLTGDVLLKDAQERLHLEPKDYLLIQLGDGKYACVKNGELSRYLEGLPTLHAQSELLYAPLAALFGGLTAETVEQSSLELWQAEAQRKVQPSQCLVVLSEGQVAGILVAKVRDASVYRGAQAKGVLSVGPASSAGPASGPEAQQGKKIYVRLKDQDDNPVKPEEKPLQLSQMYTLIFDIADLARSDSLVSDAILKYIWQSAEQSVVLTVRLESTDFDILTDPQKLTVPRSGNSNLARFDVRPKKEGPGVVNALFFKGDIFIQVITLKFTVVNGSLFTQDTSGRTLEAAFAARPRQLSLVILGDPSGGFQLVMTGAVAATAHLPITREKLDLRISDLRKALMDCLVNQRNANKVYIYQTAIDIPPDVRDLSLRGLAESGYNLYRDIFYSPDADAEANLLGDRLREITRQNDKLSIQIFSQHFMMPWGLLYMASEDEYDLSDIHPDWFLGLKHIIEQIPLQQTMQVTDARIDTRLGLKVSLNVNTDIDKQMSYPLVGDQLKYWQGIAQKGSISLVQRTNSDDLLQALRATQNTTDQIIYFYCHADSAGLAEGGPGKSAIQLGENDILLLDRMYNEASIKKTLPGQPLVFINACETAELSPIFYDGFVPYFLAKGARGVIGTEVKTPSRFAVEWARLFFDRFLAGEPLGEVILSLRKQFYKDHNNLLGLLYSLYVDGDTQLDAAILK